MEDIWVERDEFMGGNLRRAYFLKPTLTQDIVPPSPNILLSSNPTFNTLKKSRLVSLKAHPSEKWKMWVDNLKPKYQKVWEDAGIYEAILASTYKVERNKDLVICLAERWCGDTNTFVFPWGEVTISLQDIIVLGGYSVLGLPYWSPLPEKLFDVLDGMKRALREVKLSYSRPNVSCYLWMDYFMCGGKQFEHEAFLAFWLTKFVFARPNNMTTVQDFDLAIHLSRGTRIALAPLILASIYNDMTLLHKLMSSQLAQIGRLRFVCHIELVQTWAWERFPKLRPPPVISRSIEPRLARWSGVMKLQVENVRAALDSAEMSFVWRPYTKCDANVDTESLVRCLRASELVGVNVIEQYLPHRVARQFGLDQDLPSQVIRSNESSESAWRNYDRPVRGVKLPPGLVNPDVSSRYMDWWKGCAKTSSTPVLPCEPVKKKLDDSIEEVSVYMAQVLNLSKNTDCNERGADDEMVLDIFSGCSRTSKESQPTREAAESSIGCTKEQEEAPVLSQRNHPDESNVKIVKESNKSISLTGCTKEVKEVAVVLEGNHPEESNVLIVKECFGNTTEKQLIEETFVVDAREAEIINIDDFEDSTPELLYSGKHPEVIKIEDDDDTLEALKARVSRLEKLIGAHKAAN